MVSRVAKNPIEIPAGVEVKIAGREVTVKGKQGELHQIIHPAVAVEQADNLIKVAPVDSERESNALAGTMRVLIGNMVTGVSDGFSRSLQLIGVGYRAKAQANSVELTVGYSHPVVMKMPEGVKVETPAVTEIVLSGADKQKVNQIAANIRAVRPPECYKGKGIRYKGEHVQRKEGKKK